MAEGVKHVDAADQARFSAQTQEQQLLEIYINARETNGHIADAIVEIDALTATARQAKETAEATMDTMTKHLRRHELDEARERAFLDLGSTAWRVALGVIVLIGGIGSMASVVNLFM